MIPFPTPEYIYLKYPGHFENESPSRITLFIEEATTIIKKSDWDDETYPLAVTLLALHNLASNPTPVDPDDTSNPIAQMGVDPATIKAIDVDDEYSISFLSPKELGIGYGGAKGDGTLSSTRFGRAFLELEARRCKHMSFGRDDCDRHLTESAQKFDNFNHFSDPFL